MNMQLKPEIALDTDFPGGNIVFRDYDDTDETLPCLRVSPDLRDTEGYWFYWYFRLSGTKLPRKLLIDFGEHGAIGDLGPAVSYDNGISWSWVGQDSIRCNAALLSIPRETEAIRLSVGIPYTSEEFGRFVSLKQNNGLQTITSDPIIVIGSATAIERSNDNRSGPILLCTARHHACEALANYVLEGLLSAAAEQPSKEKQLPVMAVPFVDQKGVEAGDQGKNRKPHDHNRDYGHAPMYPGVRKVQSIVKSLAVPVIGIDLHCPYLCGGETNNHIYCVGTPIAENDVFVQQFAQALSKADSLPFPMRDIPYLPHGVNWNNRPLESQDTCARWLALQSNVLFATTMEIPYSLIDGTTVTVGNAVQFGKVLYRVLGDFVRSLPK